MASVIVLDNEGDEVTISTPFDFVTAVYSLGYHPKVGSIADNLAILGAISPPPDIDPDTMLIQLGMLKDETGAAVNALSDWFLLRTDPAPPPGPHTHVSADITDATTLATPDTIVRRGAFGRAKFADGSENDDVATVGQMNTLVTDSVASSSALDRARANHTGTQSADTVIDGTTNKAYTATEKTKLAGVATGATANSSDATLLARANHTGTQLSSTLSDLTETVQDIVAAFIVAGTNVTVSYNDAGNTYTINSTGGGGTTDAEVVRDTIGGALVAGSGITITVNDAGDTITIASTAVLPTRQVISGAGLAGGGDLSADRTLTVTYGSAANTAVQGNDTRVTADQAAGTASIRTLGTGALQAAAGNHAHTKADVGLGNVDNTSDVNKPVSTAQQTEIDAATGLTATNAQTGTTYTFALADRRRITTLSNAGAITATVPPNTSVAFPVGTVLKTMAIGAGQVTYAQGAGVTVNIPANRNLKTRGQNSTVYLLKTGTDAWYAFGDLEWASTDAATTEIIQDIVGGMFSDSTGVDFTYNDAGGTETLAISAASETASGIVELATAAETTTGTDNTRAVHPAGLKVELDKKLAIVSGSGLADATVVTQAAYTALGAGRPAGRIYFIVG